ncbi:MAG: flavodoxin domain-containing protein [Trueperaceae bacterium]|nr:flavodoxin domain-containing protein [Trueperaceae bacterium]
MSEHREAWVVYDSVHGNTRAIASAIAEGLRSSGPVQMVPAGDADPARWLGARAVVLGCPTHGFSMSPAMKELAAQLTRGTPSDVPLAAFDTRFGVEDMPSRVLKVIVSIVGKRAWAATDLAASASVQVRKLLAQPAGFFVRDTEGPLAKASSSGPRRAGRALITAPR